MSNITQQEAAKEIRKIAKERGLTFKRQPLQNKSNVLYHFVNRSTHKPVVEDCSFWVAYENCMSGYISGLEIAK